MWDASRVVSMAAILKIRKPGQSFIMIPITGAQMNIVIFMGSDCAPYIIGAFFLPVAYRTEA